MTESDEFQIVINGQARLVSTGCTVAGLLATLDLPSRYAVEINQEIVPKQEHGQRALQPDDVLEVVQAIGGG